MSVKPPTQSEQVRTARKERDRLEWQKRAPYLTVGIVVWWLIELLVRETGPFWSRSSWWAGLAIGVLIALVGPTLARRVQAWRTGH